MNKQDRAKLFTEAYTNSFVSLDSKTGYIDLESLKKAMQVAFVEGWNAHGRSQEEKKEEDRFRDMLKFNE